MRKVDDAKLLEMLSQGIPQKDIATHFGVMPSYITKRKKQLQGWQEPESFSRLTEKQKKFALAKAEGKSNTDAAMIAFDVTSRESAKVLGCNSMKDPDIETAISDLLAQEGLGRRQRIKRLKEIVSGPDMSVALRGIDIANRMDKLYDDVPQVTISGKVIVAEIRAKIQSLKAQLAESDGEEDSPILEAGSPNGK